MTKELEELFLSKDDEDVELAFIIAKKQGVDADILFKTKDAPGESLYGRMRYPIRMNLFDKYIHSPNNAFKWIDNE